MTVGDLNAVTVHGTYEDLSGNPIAGTVSFVASTTLLDPASDLILVPKTFTATLDGSGHFSVSLPATDDPDISPVGWSYAVTENFVGGRQFPIQVPVSSIGASVSLASLAPAVSSAGLENYVLLPTFNEFFTQVLNGQQPGGVLDGGTASVTASTAIDGGASV